jgi:hypothetical protein
MAQEKDGQTQTPQTAEKEPLAAPTAALAVDVCCAVFVEPYAEIGCSHPGVRSVNEDDYHQMMIDRF